MKHRRTLPWPCNPGDFGLFILLYFAATAVLFAFAGVASLLGWMR